MGATIHYLKAGAITLVVLLLLSFIPYTNLPPKHPNNACQIFKQYPRWYWDSLHAAKKWGIPVSVQLAIINEESHFQANALTNHKKAFGLPLPFTHITSAKGYAQAINSTWHEYKKATHHFLANRDSFYSASEFIGWYGHRAVMKAGIYANNARQLYLAYHEGIEGYLNASYRNNTHLIKKAAQVENQALLYQTQLTHCQSTLPKKTWYNYWH